MKLDSYDLHNLYAHLLFLKTNEDYANMPWAVRAQFWSSEFIRTQEHKFGYIFL